MSVTLLRSQSEIRRDLRRLREERRVIERQTREALQGVDRDIRDREAELDAARRRTPHHSYGGLDPHVQAGHNADAMERVFARRRTCTMAVAASEAGISSGTSTWAIRALIDDGVIVPTGRRVDRSKEYRYVPRQQRETTLRPGE